MSKKAIVNTTPKPLGDPGLILIVDFSVTTLNNQIILDVIEVDILTQSWTLWQVYVPV